MVISAQGKVGDNFIVVRRKAQDDPNALEKTDENGEAEFVVDACTNCDPIKITV